MKRRFPVLLTCCMLEYLEKCPCELWKLVQPGGASSHSGFAHVTSGCFCNQVEKRPTVATFEQPLPSIKELCHKRRHSMQPVLENMILGTHSLDEFIHMAILSQRLSGNILFLRYFLKPLPSNSRWQLMMN
ncbi:hypothetical protein Patl1_26570 [Pistacia atlantica]|uniref:Uncharacterized protein n=1 Tax=Pistacia atlantica TaxID=434234 RepID=A0ACC1B4P1_9ROSI|nr:hypothetical protein Patl1_26570 [Pistacia atlantica]